jgi:hypothetical protein
MTVVYFAVCSPMLESLAWLANQAPRSRRSSRRRISTSCDTTLAHLSIDAVRRYYERAHEECRMIYDRLPSPKHADGGAGVEVAVSTPDLYRSYSLQNHTPVVSLPVSEVRVFVN